MNPSGAGRLASLNLHHINFTGSVYGVSKMLLFRPRPAAIHADRGRSVGESAIYTGILDTCEMGGSRDSSALEQETQSVHGVRSEESPTDRVVKLPGGRWLPGGRTSTPLRFRLIMGGRMETLGNQSGWLFERARDPHGPFELLVACPEPARGIVYLTHHQALPFTPPERWDEVGRIRKSSFYGPHLGASMIPAPSGGIEAIAVQSDGLVAHFGFSIAAGWSGPTILPVRAGGPPALIRGRFGPSGNLELIVPRSSCGLSHFWRDGNPTGPWREAPQPATGGVWTGVALIHSSYGNLELAGVVDGRLVALWQKGLGGAWSDPKPLSVEATGRPALLQSSRGNPGNFELVAVQRDGCLCQLIRNNDTPECRWSFPSFFGRDFQYDDVTMIESSYGRLEVFARVRGRGRFVHYRRTPREQWEGPIPLSAISCDSKRL